MTYLFSNSSIHPPQVAQATHKNRGVFRVCQSSTQPSSDGRQAVQPLPVSRFHSRFHAYFLYRLRVAVIHAVLQARSSVKSPPIIFFICVNTACMLLAVLLLAQWQAANGAQVASSEQTAPQAETGREMNRLSRELEKRDKLKEWPDARRALSQPGYVLLTTTLDYVGGNDYEEYFALFSEAANAQGKRPPVLIGWAMVPAPFRFENLSFEVQANAAGEKHLRLSLAGSSEEAATPGEPAFVDYLLPGKDAWGVELGK
jgi:hypothetical protein